MNEDMNISDMVNNTLNNLSSEVAKEEVKLGFSTIEEYKALTGKRYRMKREQVVRGISREEAFQEFLNELKEKSSQQQGA